MKAKLLKLRHAIQLGKHRVAVRHTCYHCGSSGACGDCCVIPETPCPGRCATEVQWSITRGAMAEATVSIRNPGPIARQYQFAVTPLRGLNPGTAQLTLSQPSALVQPAQSVTLAVQLVDSAALQAGQEYRGEISIAGSGWTQYLCLTVCTQLDPYAELDLRQGDSLLDRLRGFALAPCPTITWSFGRGTAPEAALLLHNDARSTRLFNIETSLWTGADSGSQIVIAPNSIQLDAGVSAIAKVRLQSSATLSAGRSYQAELKVFGVFEQRIALHAFVQPDAHTQVELEHGEIPTRIRAHRWYDHFQCTEPCVVS